MAFSPEFALERLGRACEEARLAHAYLITGPSGSGKADVAAGIARLVLGTEEPSRHPDFHQIEPESASRRILVEQIRNLETSLHRKSLEGSTKIALVREADRLQPSAANAFLKTLEEPPDGVHLVLTSDHPESVLPTILSRCIPVPLKTPAEMRTPERSTRVAALASELLDAESTPSVGAVFQFVRGFQAVLAEAREEISAAAAAELKEDQKHYKNATDGKWLEEREDQLKAKAAGAAVRERGILLQAVAGEIGRRLRALAAEGAGGSGGCREHMTRLIRRIESMEDLRADLERNVHEALALESGFLEVFLSRQ